MKSFVFPGNIEPEILGLSAEQIPYMRTQWFSDLMLESEALMLELIGCPGGRVIPYTASGTAAMDSVVNTYVKSRTKALVVNGGTFGARWADLCRYYHVAFDEFRVGFGQDPDWEQLNERIESGNYDSLLIQHHETSSGYLYDLGRISRSCREHHVSLIVDAISSFLTDPLSMQDLHIDIAVLSSQKGMNLPPGLSFLVLSPNVLATPSFSAGGYYVDWNRQLKDMERGQTSFSPATQLFRQLNLRLKMVQRMGLEKAMEGVRIRAQAFREECRSRGWSFSADRLSNCMTGIVLSRPVGPLVAGLQKKDVYVMPCQDPSMIRVAHLGTLGVSDDVELAEEIGKWEQMESE